MVSNKKGKSSDQWIYLNTTRAKAAYLESRLDFWSFFNMLRKMENSMFYITNDIEACIYKRKSEMFSEDSLLKVSKVPYFERFDYLKCESSRLQMFSVIYFDKQTTAHFDKLTKRMYTTRNDYFDFKSLITIIIAAKNLTKVRRWSNHKLHLMNKFYSNLDKQARYYLEPRF